MPSEERFGFRFWLLWILWFAAAFLIAVAIWTFALQSVFGSFRGPELTITWCVAVFGSWFLLLVPFMRKKEQIWKRLNQDQEKTLNVWLPAMTLFLLLLIASAFLWSFIFRSEISNPLKNQMHPAWAKAVFSTWLILLLPFLIWMYKKADVLYQAAIARQTQRGPVFKTVFIERSQRLLSDAVSKKLKQIAPTLNRGHVVDVILKNGKKIPHVFILNHAEILGVYDQTHFEFIADDVVDIEPVLESRMIPYEESKWLRLDGRV